MKLSQQELAKKHSPFGLKEIVMESKNVKRIMLADYACIPKVITSLCGEFMAGYESIAGSQRSNSAASRNYTDFWSMHDHSPPLNPFDQFWDDIYDILSEVCCLELVKPNH